jgi:hypothetical protein
VFLDNLLSRPPTWSIKLNDAKRIPTPPTGLKVHIELYFVHPILKAVECQDPPGASNTKGFNCLKHPLGGKLEEELRGY